MKNRNRIADATKAPDSDEWFSPIRIIGPIHRIWGRILFDPFWAPTCITNPVVGCTAREDGFRQDWRRVSQVARESAGPGLDVFSNGPYSRMTDWQGKAVAEASRGVEQISLIKASTAELWWRLMVWDSATAVLFPYGRLRHDTVVTKDRAGATLLRPREDSNPALYSSAVVYHGSRHGMFEQYADEVKGKLVWLR